MRAEFDETLVTGNDMIDESAKKDKKKKGLFHK